MNSVECDSGPGGHEGRERPEPEDADATLDRQGGSAADGVAWLSRYEPDFLIFWAGINNSWNSAEMTLEGEGLRAWLDQQGLRSRVYRFVRNRLHDGALERTVPEQVWRVGGGRKTVSDRVDRSGTGMRCEVLSREAGR